MSQFEFLTDVYGLTVAGAGLVAYVDPAFRVGIDEADIVVEKRDASARMKRATGGILGDVTNEGQVDDFDALYVRLYVADNSIILPNNGDISLGDLNSDGMVNSADAVLFVRYLTDPADPRLLTGIGAVSDAASDRTVLVSLYNATGGPNWTRATNWLSDQPIGDWHGVTTDATGRVISIVLSGNTLTGAIPKEIGNLKNLESLHLHPNKLTGCIPSALSRVANNDLEQLKLPNCSEE